MPTAFAFPSLPSLVVRFSEDSFRVKTKYYFEAQYSTLFFEILINKC